MITHKISYVFLEKRKISILLGCEKHLSYDISMCFYAVCSGSSLCTVCTALDSAFLQVDTKDGQADLSVCWAHIIRWIF